MLSTCTMSLLLWEVYNLDFGPFGTRNQDGTSWYSWWGKTKTLEVSWQPSIGKCSCLFVKKHCIPNLVFAVLWVVRGLDHGATKIKLIRTWPLEISLSFPFLCKLLIKKRIYTSWQRGGERGGSSLQNVFASHVNSDLILLVRFCS